MPQNTAKRQDSGRGRSTPKKKDRQTSGRYTPPIPQESRRSPRWYPWLILGLLVGGVFVIMLNYINVLPASPTNWYLVGGLVSILAGALAATQYR
ncbi:MAG TPA: cell division protein CrgA [Acidimicrobiales bacterium]|jgi:hypothetical protein|nr:cell division protein CrgA [Acidimicrobiales bacterium]